MTWGTPHADELERVMMGESVRAPRREYGTRAEGEWDYLCSLPRRTVRRLIGSGAFTRGGMAPDEAADWIRDRVPALGESADTCDCMAWYVRTALAAIGERRREAHRRRHEKYARSLGHPTYYAYRRQIALEHGHGSVWHMRKDRGWTS